MLLVKMLVNRVISTTGAKFITGDINDFYLNTPLKLYDYVRMRLEDTRKEIVAE